MAGSRKQAKHGHGGSGFAGTGFADDGHPLAGIHAEGRVAHGMHGLASSVVKSTWRFLTSNSGPWARCMASRLFSVFISVIEYPFTYTQAVRLFGSSASLTASPIMMNASTVMASAADG